MKFPLPNTRVLCVCTSGKDRSPIMADYINERGEALGIVAKAVGINRHNCQLGSGHHITYEDLFFADVALVVSTTHHAFLNGMLCGASYAFDTKIHLVAGLSGPVSLDLLKRDHIPTWKDYVRACMAKSRVVRRILTGGFR